MKTVCSGKYHQDSKVSGVNVMEQRKEYIEIIHHFRMEQNIVSVEHYGSGHIYYTFLVKTEGGENYIL